MILDSARNGEAIAPSRPRLGLWIVGGYVLFCLIALALLALQAGVGFVSSFSLGFGAVLYSLLLFSLESLNLIPALLVGYLFFTRSSHFRLAFIMWVIWIDIVYGYAVMPLVEWLFMPDILAEPVELIRSMLDEAINQHLALSLFLLMTHALTIALLAYVIFSRKFKRYFQPTNIPTAL